MDVETVIERIMDAYSYEEFLQALLEYDSIYDTVRDIFPELFNEEDYGEV